MNRCFSVLFVLMVGAAGSRGHAQTPERGGPGADRGQRVIAASPAVGAAAERRVALVIGNGAYANAPLKNPVNDARAVARALGSLGFDVTLKENIGLKDMFESVRSFGNAISAGKGVSLFYYAGHGMQVGGNNYLIPVDANIEQEDEVKFQTLDASLVLAKMDSARSRVNIVILDACRNNPFARSFRSESRGLATMDAPSGTLIAYATAPGSVAADGEGENGLFTSRLLGAMRVPGLKIEEVFKRIRVAVRDATSGKQVPWEASSLTGDFYFLPGGEMPQSVGTPALQVGAMTDPVQVELAFWNSIKDSTDVRDFQAYLAGYPRGQFADLAHLRVEKYQQAAVPSSQPTATPAGGRCPAGMVLVPAGEFWMGSPEGEGFPCEHPRHRVQVDAFCLDTYEVTNVAYERFDRSHRSERDKSSKCDTCPVVYVNWDQAARFCESQGKRLPVEAEWEKACRGGLDGKKFPWGDEIPNTGRVGNFADEKLKRADPSPYWDIVQGYDDGFVYAAPVGSFVPNGFGLFEMSGNVTEWVADGFDENYYAKSPERNPTGPAGRTFDGPVKRGGSWGDGSNAARCAYRSAKGSVPRDGSIGVRCARAPLY